MTQIRKTDRIIFAHDKYLPNFVNSDCVLNLFLGFDNIRDKKSQVNGTDIKKKK